MDLLTKPISVINRCTHLFRDTKLEPVGLTAGQVPYILRICRAPGQTQEELAEELHVHKSSVTRKLTCLENDGWITRTPCAEDRRALQVYPSEKAQAVLPEVRTALREWSDYLTEGFTEDETATLLALLDRVSQRAEAWAAQKELD